VVGPASGSTFIILNFTPSVEVVGAYSVEGSVVVSAGVFCYVFVVSSGFVVVDAPISES
jgi:hypothetical protein